jgi:hypothetical protein
MDNTEIFLDFWKNYVWPEQKPITYRLYYNDQGAPLFYSMEELPGKYLEITAEQFHFSDFKIRVKNGKIEPLPQNLLPKLIPSNTGTPCHSTDVTIIVNDTVNATYWNLKTHDTN